jgi:hypothetical protein
MKRTKLLVFAALAAFAIAAAHIMEVTQGIHFKEGPVDFGEPPPRERIYEPPGDGMGVFEEAWRPGTVFLTDSPADDAFEAAREKGEAKDVLLCKAAREEERRGAYSEALAQYRSMLSHGQGDPAYLQEHIELLKQVLVNSDSKGFHAYLDGKETTAAWVQPYIRYDALCKQDPSAERAAAFEKLALTFPNSSRAEPALMTAARDRLGDETSPGRTITEPDLMEGKRILDELLSLYPKTRFRKSAIGWLARVDCQQGNYRRALQRYWEQLMLGVNGEQRLKLLNSMVTCESRLGRKGRIAYTICLILDSARRPVIRAYSIVRLDNQLESFDAKDAKEFWACLKVSPRALSSYLDYRLDRTKVSPDLLALSTTAQITGAYSGHIYGRLAEAAYRLDHLDQTRRYGKLCLLQSTDQNDRAKSVFLQGSVAQKLGDVRLATRFYEQVLHQYPSSYLAGGARENLALLYEHSGQFGKALDIYYALKYDYDIAYLIDARMSTQEISAYLKQHPHHQDAAAIRYSVGLRYIRQHRFAEADRVLATVPEWKRKAYSKSSNEQDTDNDEPDGRKDPLVTSHQLAHLYGVAAKAKGSEAKAKALVSIGNYYYNNRNLLLYNLRLWHWERANSIGFSWNDDTATKLDDAAIRRHHQEHECIAQALDVFEDLIRRYPHSSSAQRAAYRGACAAWRLSNFSPYWRWVAAKEGLRQKAAHLMNVASHGQDKSLARTAAKYASVYIEFINDSEDGEFKQMVPRRKYSPRSED